MAVRKVVYYPHKCLSHPAELVTEFDQALQELVDDMFETMYAYDGVGLAAPQIAISRQLTVIDTGQNPTEKIVLVNPEILELKEIGEKSEGCLSVPGHYDKVPRAEKLIVRAVDLQGKPYEFSAEGLLAHVIQHEVDHLNGKLFISYLSRLKRQRIREKLLKQKRLKADPRS